MLVGNRIGDLEEECFAPDGVRGERADVEVAGAVHDYFGTEGFVPREALRAAATGVVQVAEADSVASMRDGVVSMV